jgi:ABC-2 type transport system ATP-binding protein
VLGLDPTVDGNQIRARVGYMPEHDCLPPDLSAAEFVTHMARMSGLPKTTARERASEALRHVGLYEERYRQIGGYSTGMKQRVKLAQALVHDPDLLLLDEPTNGLDPAGRDAMLNLIERIGTEFGISVLVCSHLLGEIERICTALVAIDGGRLLRAAQLSDMTAATEVLSVEVSEGTDELAARLAAANLPVRRDGRLLLVPLADETTYDLILTAVAELDLPLHRLDQRRHRVAELFATGPVASGEPPAALAGAGATEGGIR